MVDVSEMLEAPGGNADQKEDEQANESGLNQSRCQSSQGVDDRRQQILINSAPTRITPIDAKTAICPGPSVARMCDRLWRTDRPFPRGRPVAVLGRHRSCSVDDGQWPDVRKCLQRIKASQLGCFMQVSVRAQRWQVGARHIGRDRPSGWLSTPKCRRIAPIPGRLVQRMSPLYRTLRRGNLREPQSKLRMLRVGATEHHHPL